MNCQNIGSVHAQGSNLTVYHCFGGQTVCTLEKSPLKLLDQSPMQFCGPHCPGWEPWPKVSIIVAGRNSEKWVGNAIRSALNQTIPCEVIYSDDCSTDKTLDVVMQLRTDDGRWARLTANQDWIEQERPEGSTADHGPLSIITSEVHRGVCATRNVGATMATGEYVCFLDADDIMPPDYIQRHLAEVKDGQPFVYGHAQAFSEALSPPDGPLWKATPWEEWDKWSFNSVNTSALYRRDVFMSCGQWQEIPTTWDHDLALRASRYGSLKPSVSSAVLLYRQHPTSWSAQLAEKEYRRLDVMELIRRRNVRLTVSTIYSGRLPGLFEEWIERVAQSVRYAGLLPWLIIAVDPKAKEQIADLERMCHVWRNSFVRVQFVVLDPMREWTDEADRRNAVSSWLAASMQKFRSLTWSDLIWSIEDDILVPLMAASDLFRAAIEGVRPAAVVSGMYRNRHIPDYLVGGHSYNGKLDPQFMELTVAHASATEPFEVDYCGMGCAMFWTDRPMVPKQWESHYAGVAAHDWAFCFAVKSKGGKVVMLPGVKCGHVRELGDVLGFDVDESVKKAVTEIKSIEMRPACKFAYFTGTNRANERPLIECMLRSARAAGVSEDFHLFSPFPVEGCIHHPIAPDRGWNMHMAKIEFLRELKDLEQYDYFVWLDTDNYFVRHPGDFKELIRDEKCFVSMESDLTSPDVKHREWYGLFFKTLPQKPKPADIMSPTIHEHYKSFGVHGPKYYNTNGGFFIVRRDAIDEFDKTSFAIFDKLQGMGFRRVPDEVPLAIAGDILVSDPSLNTFDKHSHLWAAEWRHGFFKQLPDGAPYRAMDWLTGADLGMVNPAIVHLIRGKDLMAGAPFAWRAPPELTVAVNIPGRMMNPARMRRRRIVRPAQAVVAPPSKEPVGSKLHDVIEEIGLGRVSCGPCIEWKNKMDQWGVDGCERHRAAIIAHLNTEASIERQKRGGWLNMIKVASAGYLSTSALLDEAIKRATPTEPTTRPESPDNTLNTVNTTNPVI